MAVFILSIHSFFFSSLAAPPLGLLRSGLFKYFGLTMALGQMTMDLLAKMTPLSGDSNVSTIKRSRELSVCLKVGSEHVEQLSLHIDLRPMVASSDPSGLAMPTIKQRLLRSPLLSK